MKKFKFWGLIIALVAVVATAFGFAFNANTRTKALAANNEDPISNVAQVWGISSNRKLVSDIKADMLAGNNAYGNVKYYEIDPTYEETITIGIYNTGSNTELGDSEYVYPGNYRLIINAPQDTVNSFAEQLVNQVVTVKLMLDTSLSGGELQSTYGSALTYTTAAWYGHPEEFTNLDVDHPQVDVELYFVDGEEEEITVNSSSNAGTYNLRARLTGEDASYYVLSDYEYNYTIAKKSITVSIKDAFDQSLGSAYTYTGNALVFTLESDIELVNAGLEITSWYDSNASEDVEAVINVGTYTNPTIALTGANKDNYEISNDLSATSINVTKREVTLVVGAEANYTGSATNPTYTVSVTRSVDEVNANVSVVTPEVSLSGKETNIGTGYTLTISLEDTDNYEINIGSGIYQDSQDFTYGIVKAGEEQINATFDQLATWYYRLNPSNYAEMFDVTVTGVNDAPLSIDTNSWQYTTDPSDSTSWTNGMIPVASIPGTYYVRVQTVENETHFAVYVQTSVVIAKAPIYMRPASVLTYNGSAQAATPVFYIYQVGNEYLAETILAGLFDNYFDENAKVATNTTVAQTNAGSYALTATINATLDSYYEIVSDDENAVYVIQQKEIGITWTTYTEPELVYSGTAKVVTATATGVEDGDTCNITIVIGEEQNNVNVGSFTYTATELSNSNYCLPESGLTATYTITRKALSVTADNKTITYGDNAPTYTVTYEGFVDGEDEEDLEGELAFACEYNKADANHNGAAGYVITPSGLTSDNYEITFNAGALTVNKKALTVTADDKTITYGDAVPQFTVTYDGLVNGDDPAILQWVVNYNYSYNPADDENNNAGTYTITPTAFPYPANYEVTNVAGTLTVEQREITITWANYTHTYDGNSHSATATAGNVLQDDTVTITVSGAQIAANANAYTATATAVSDSNYCLPATGLTQEFTIEFASLTVVAAEQTGSLTYNGGSQRATVNATANTVDGTQPTFTYSTEEDGVFTANVPAFINAGEYTVYYRVNAANHNQETGSFTVSIAKLNVTISWQSEDYSDGVYRYTYDGQVHIPTYEIVGLLAIDFEKVSGSYEHKKVIGGSLYGAAAYPQHHTGTYRTTISIVAIGDGTQDDVDNYQLPNNPYRTTIIDAREVSLIWSDHTNLIYNKQDQKITVELGNVVEGDNVSAVVTYTRGSAVTQAVNAGSYIATVSNLNNNANNDYVLPATTSENFTINQLEAVLAWSNDAFTYDGNSHVPTVTVTNLYNGDVFVPNISGAQTNASLEYYTATASSVNDNYKISNDNPNRTHYFTIGFATITDISVSQADSHTYDGDYYMAIVDEQATTVDGSEVTFVYSLTNNGINNFSAEVPELINAGTITVYYWVSAPNHNSTNGEFTVTITHREVKINWSNTLSVYDGESHVPTATASDIVDGETINLTVTGEQINRGQYTATVTGITGATAANYVLPADVTQSFNIYAREITVTITPKTSTYGDERVALEATVTEGSIVEGDTNVYVLACNVDAQTGVGTYNITGECQNNNYGITFVGEENAYTVEARVVTLTWGNTQFEYNEQEHVPTVTLGNVVDGDEVEVTVTGAQTEAGQYTATATNITNTNYALPEEATVQFTIAKPTSYDKQIDEEEAATDGVNLTDVFKNVDTTAEDAELKIEVGDTTVVFDKNAIDMIAEGDNIVFKLDTKTGEEAAETYENAEMVFELTLTGATFENGKVTISADFENNAPEGMVAKVYYVDENGNLVDMHATFENGKVTFETNHFSTYIIKYVSKANAKVGALTTWAISLIAIACAAVVSALVIIIVSLVFRKKGAAKEEAEKDKKPAAKSKK